MDESKSAGKQLRVLALEGYYGGSHRAFLDTWIAHSRHDWRLISLPARHWKWRMRGSAIWFADEIAKLPAGGFDVIFTSDMTSVADVRALLPPAYRLTPIVCYFHENQLTYPLSPHDIRDYQYGMTNITSILAADAVWFNSEHHRSAFNDAACAIVRKMPSHRPELATRLHDHTCVHYPAVEPPPSDLAKAPRNNNRLRILWNHRWEYDKNPRPFLSSLIELDRWGVDFELVFLGERFRAAPPAVADLTPQIEHRVVIDGFMDDREAYWRALASCDVAVSTAIQENFGIAVVEAILAGCQPLLPNRLSYPELLPQWAHEACLYPSDTDLTARLKAIAAGGGANEITQRLQRDLLIRFRARDQCARLDEALAAISHPTNDNPPISG